MLTPTPAGPDWHGPSPVPRTPFVKITYLTVPAVVTDYGERKLRQSGAVVRSTLVAITLLGTGCGGGSDPTTPVRRSSTASRSSPSRRRVLSTRQAQPARTTKNRNGVRSRTRTRSSSPDRLPFCTGHAPMRGVRLLRRRLRCAIRTGGAHQFEISTGRCLYCRRRWEDVHRQDDVHVPGSATSGHTWITRLFRRVQG